MIGQSDNFAYREKQPRPRWMYYAAFGIIAFVALLFWAVGVAGQRDNPAVAAPAPSSVVVPWVNKQEVPARFYSFAELHEPLFSVPGCIKYLDYEIHDMDPGSARVAFSIAWQREIYTDGSWIVAQWRIIEGELEGMTLSFDLESGPC